MKRISLFIILQIVAIQFFGVNYYVATTGNDSNNGLSITQAFLTISKVLNTIQPGDAAFILGGTYSLNQTTQISGEELNPIVIQAYENQSVILEGTGNTSNGGRFRLRHNWYVIRGLDFANGDAGITITSGASNNIIDNCSAHNCYYTGFYLAGGASNNLIKNCDAYDMYDSGTNGGNADGFAISGQNSLPGPGNLFVNCRAHDNSDDGFDVWKAGYPIEFDNCLSYNNGKFDGDGNGFKLGINSTNNDMHILKNCIAWNNKQNGFDYNDTELSQTLYNCTAYNNGRNYKFWNISGAPNKHNIQNCISAISTSNDILLQTIIDENTNSWNFVNANNATIIDDNFISTNDSVITGPRNIDGSINESDFLKLKPTSVFIDAGVDVGLQYNGAAPDLGAFETNYTTSANSIKQQTFVKIFPNPSVYQITITSNEILNNIIISDVTGKIIYQNKIDKKTATVNISYFTTGLYLLKVNDKLLKFTKKN